MFWKSSSAPKNAARKFMPRLPDTVRPATLIIEFVFRKAATNRRAPHTEGVGAGLVPARFSKKRAGKSPAPTIMFERFRRRSYELETLDKGTYTPTEYEGCIVELQRVNRWLGDAKALRGSLLKE